MNPFRNSTSLALWGVLATLATTSVAIAAEYGNPSHAPSLGRCAAYGPGIVDLGGGVCGRVVGQIDNRLRVDMGASHAALRTWSSSNGTSHAAMRTDSAGMLPGVGDMQHLRVRDGLESYDPFH